MQSNIVYSWLRQARWRVTTKLTFLCLVRAKGDTPLKPPLPSGSKSKSSRRFTNVKKEKLSSPYQVRLPRDTENLMRKIAEDSGKPISFIIRNCLQSSRPVFRGRVPVAVQRDRLTALRYLQKSSNNLNQIARHLNTLNLKHELSYENTIHYLKILDTIEAQMNLCLRLCDAH